MLFISVCLQNSKIVLFTRQSYEYVTCYRFNWNSTNDLCMYNYIYKRERERENNICGIFSNESKTKTTTWNPKWQIVSFASWNPIISITNCDDSPLLCIIPYFNIPHHAFLHHEIQTDEIENKTYSESVINRSENGKNNFNTFWHFHHIFLWIRKKRLHVSLL